MATAPSTTSITLTWDPPASAVSQDVQYKKSTDSSWTTVITVGASVDTQIVSGLLNNTSYDFRVVSNCNLGGPIESDPVTKINLTCPSISLESDEDSITYSFNNVGGEITGYEIDLLDSEYVLLSIQYGSTTSPITGVFSDLDPNTLYRIQVTVTSSSSKTCPAASTSTHGDDEFGNEEQSQDFIKEGCEEGTHGTLVTYTVFANTYFAATLLEANDLAQDDIDANGQTYANENGECVVDGFITMYLDCSGVGTLYTGIPADWAIYLYNGIFIVHGYDGSPTTHTITDVPDDAETLSLRVDNVGPNDAYVTVGVDERFIISGGSEIWTPIAKVPSDIIFVTISDLI